MNTASNTAISKDEKDLDEGVIAGSDNSSNDDWGEYPLDTV